MGQTGPKYRAADSHYRVIQLTILSTALYSPVAGLKLKTPEVPLWLLSLLMPAGRHRLPGATATVMRISALLLLPPPASPIAPVPVTPVPDLPALMAAVVHVRELSHAALQTAHVLLVLVLDRPATMAVEGLVRVPRTAIQAVLRTVPVRAVPVPALPAPMAAEGLVMAPKPAVVQILV